MWNVGTAKLNTWLKLDGGEQFAVVDVRDPIHEVEELFIKVSAH